MQSFIWKMKYTAIYMVWCVGYLDDQELVNFLRTAKSRLIQDEERYTRRSKRRSFLFVLDNLLGEHEEANVIKGQRLRTQRQLEVLFSMAGLIIHEQSEVEPMPNNYRDVMLWALY